MEAALNNDPGKDSDEQLQMAQCLVAAIKQNNTERVELLIKQLSASREFHLYQEIGQLTRELHDSLYLFNDRCLEKITTVNIPDVRSRLDYVIGKTEESALSTISLAEQIISVCNDICVTDEADKQKIEKIRSHLTSIILAQEYQDLTGQVIKQVISLIKEAEEKLVSIIQSLHTDDTVVKTNPEPMLGPQIVRNTDEEVLQAQDEVDQLLSKLGF